MSIEGVLLIDKPAGLVSMRVVERVRRLTRTRRAGHAGTLDPAATGLLPLCLGRATKIASLLLGEDKEYIATVQLGLETDTLDLDGEVLGRSPVPEGLTAASLAGPLAKLRGRITQRPPAFSAVRVDGQRLYDRARRGETVEAPEREVVVHELELLRLEPPELELRVRCGKGTYIRSLAADLGRELGCGAALAALRRTRVGALALDRALTLEAVAEAVEAGRLQASVLSMAEALGHLPAATVTAAGLAKLGQGQQLTSTELVGGELPELAEGERVRLLDADGRLAALAEPRDGRLQPRRVFHS